MDKRTLKFECLITMANFSKIVSVGYFMNTNNFTLTGKFPPADIELAIGQYSATQIETTEKVFTY